MTENNYNSKTVEVAGKSIKVFTVENDSNGNPRYVVHFLQLGVALADYDEVKFPGVKKYRARWFGGGYVFSTYDLKGELEFIINAVKEYYEGGDVS